MCRRTDIQKKILNNIVIRHLGFHLDGVPSSCHIWQGSDSGNGRGGGYPRMSLDGHTVAVHIVSYTNENGFVPGKKQIDHICNNRMCVNPDHLEMVTHKENQRRRDLRKKEKENALSAILRLSSRDESDHQSQCP
ncbi:MAG: HNH endonuclease [Actinobacteria bacterium]|nr:HNH endonuclease [Actinomycetota bacterium]